MIWFIVRRVLWGVPTLLVIATLTFIMMHAVPGGPFDREKTLPDQIKQNIEAKYHLDEPLWKQYVLYMERLARGDLGPSYKYLGRSVNDILADSLPVSATLGLAAVVLSVIVGLLAGLGAGLRPGSAWDYGGMFGATFGISVPAFVLGALLILVFSSWLGWFPPALWEGLRHGVLPAVTLAAAPAAYIARLSRSSVLEVVDRDFIKTARAKGLRERSVVFAHILRNALLPVVTVLGPLLAILVTGSFVVEYIFSIPGMGRFFITAVSNRDYPLIMGVTLVYAVFIIVANMLVDLVYAFLDPRIRVS